MDVDTSIHWHGILLPNAMDGVPFLTYPPFAFPAAWREGATHASANTSKGTVLAGRVS
jgi:hypothetical protein